MIVECQGCCIHFEDKEATLAYNMGSGPEYFCRKCRPPAKSADEVIRTFDAFIGRTNEPDAAEDGGKK